LHALEWFSLRGVNWRFRKNRWVTHFFWPDLARVSSRRLVQVEGTLSRNTTGVQNVKSVNFGLLRSCIWTTSCKPQKYKTSARNLLAYCPMHQVTDGARSIRPLLSASRYCGRDEANGLVWSIGRSMATGDGERPETLSIRSLFVLYPCLS
jgi:hypothetical protein